MDTPARTRTPYLRRGAATRAGAHISEQLQSSPISPRLGDDELSFGEPPGSRDRHRPSVKRSYSGKGRSTSKKAPPSSIAHPITAPPTFVQSRKTNGRGRGKKRSLSDAGSASDSDSLTPLSSPAPTARTVPKDTPVKKPVVKRRETFSTSRPLRNKKSSTALQKSANSSTTEILPPPTPLMGQSSNSSVGTVTNGTGSHKIGALAWILVDKRGHLVKDISTHTQTMWWPAFKQSSSPPLFGLIGEVYPGAITGDVLISDPPETNIKDASSGLLFTTSTFIHRAEDSDDASLSLNASPKKKRKVETVETVEKRWVEAVAKMDAYNGGGESGAEESDATSDEEQGKSSSPSPSNVKKRQANGKGREASPPDDDEDDWTPPEADDTLEIPGELVIAKDKPISSIYWPAMITAYMPPSRPKNKNRRARVEGKYHVVYLDRVEKDIPRAWFYAPTDPEFGHCEVGEYKSSVNELADDDEDIARVSSPEPQNPPPDKEKFEELPILEQLSYAKPILTEILNGRYEPAKDRHEGYIKGGAARANTENNAAARGAVSPSDVSKLQKYILRWTLREDGFGGAKENIYRNLEVEAEAEDVIPSSPAPAPPSSFDPSTAPQIPTTEEAPAPMETDEPSHQPPRQEGCEDYETLTQPEKIGYCMSVLAPEAIIQILLWRKGKRTTMELLSEDEEKELHKAGDKLRDETDWVRDIMRMYAACRRNIDKAEKKKGGDGAAVEEDLQVGTSGTRSRPRRSKGLTR